MNSIIRKVDLLRSNTCLCARHAAHSRTLVEIFAICFFYKYILTHCSVMWWCTVMTGTLLCNNGRTITSSVGDQLVSSQSINCPWQFLPRFSWFLDHSAVLVSVFLVSKMFGETRISLVPFRFFRGPLFPNQVTGQELLAGCLASIF